MQVRSINTRPTMSTGEAANVFAVKEAARVWATSVRARQNLPARWLIPVLVAAPTLYSRRQRSRGLSLPTGVCACRCAPSDARSSNVLNEASAEEEFLRLSQEISEAIATDDAPRAQKAQRELRQIQLEKPSLACRHRIRENCISASTLLRLGDRESIRVRVNAVKKLGRWLRWPQAAKKNLVPVSTIVDALLCALRSTPEVAWSAQCALFHVVRCHQAEAQNVKEATRGKITRLLLDGQTNFPLCLPELNERAAKGYEAALRVSVVRCFFTQLQSLTLIDPGYGEHWETQDHLALLGGFAQRLGKSLYSLQSLKVFAFEDCAIKLILPALWMPKLRSLKMVACCQQRQSQKAILTLINRNRSQLEELELNLWTDLIEAEDPVRELELLPEVRRLSVRVPLLPAWQHFGDLCPLLEELNFLYDQDVALNAAEPLMDVEDPSEEEEILAHRTRHIYRDAVRFAQDLHRGGFRELAASCPKLRVIRFKMWDNSFGYHSAPAKEQVCISWRRSDHPIRPFARNAEENNATRTMLQARAEVAPLRSWTEEELEEGRDITEEDALAAAARVMLQVIRCFDDASLEAELGLL
ncbi:unnamed protein product [Durusdinium trenchii]|uniref:Uncharacterized protein n=1 Tax=Durusdinium trenchii TaxID=1381693 RepID=A0ABP0JU41_9DINO